MVLYMFGLLSLTPWLAGTALHCTLQSRTVQYPRSREPPGQRIIVPGQRWIAVDAPPYFLFLRSRSSSKQFPICSKKGALWDSTLVLAAPWLLHLALLATDKTKHSYRAVCDDVKWIPHVLYHTKHAEGENAGPGFLARKRCIRGVGKSRPRPQELHRMPGRYCK